MTTEKEGSPGERFLSLAEAVAGVADSRALGRSKYVRVQVRVIPVCAVAFGVEDFVGSEARANERIDWLRRFLPLQNGVP